MVSTNGHYVDREGFHDGHWCGGGMADNVCLAVTSQNFLECAKDIKI